MNKGRFQDLPLHPTTMAVWFDYTRGDVVAEMWHAVTKHGPVTKDPMRGVATLTEELGEVAAEALEATRKTVTPAIEMESLMAMCNELNDLIAYAILLRVSMEGKIHKLKGIIDSAAQPLKSQEG